MKKIFFYVISLSIIIFLETSTLINRYISINKVIPDFLLIYLIIISFYADEFESITIGFLSGLVLDFFTSSLFGFNSILNVTIIFIFIKIKKIINIEKIGFLITIIFTSLIFKLFALYFFGFLFNELFTLYSNVLLNYFINIFYTLFVSPLFFYIITLIIKKFNIYKDQIFI